MRKIVILSLLFAACNTRSHADLQKEYDSVLLEIKDKESTLNAAQTQADKFAQWKDDFEKSGMYEAAKFDDTQIIKFTRFIDSVSIRKMELEKRRQELATKLYK